MSETHEEPQRCPAVKEDGSPCIGKPTVSGFCFAHDPAACAYRAKGGKATRKSGKPYIKVLVHSSGQGSQAGIQQPTVHAYLNENRPAHRRCQDSIRML